MKRTILIRVLLLTIGTVAVWAEEVTKPLSPKDYSHWHILASQPRHAQWGEAMQHLAKGGDAFTLEYLKILRPWELTRAQTETLQNTISATEKRVAQEDLETFTKLVQIRLERQAFADLTCSRLEVPLKWWTPKFIRKHLDSPDVVAELKGIQSGYEPSFDDIPLTFGIRFEGFPDALKRRVPSYATSLLQTPAPAAPGQGK